ncbi:MAG: hypothetical protein R2932_00410 [Caldilineaceae bacterium]
MTRIAIRIAAMSLLIIITYVGIWAIPTHTELVYSSVLDKHALLVKLPSPRIIFVGGSGVALGLDSTLIEETLGLPVINMGVNAGFGLHYMVEEVRPWIRPDDIIVIVPEYEHFYGTLFEGDQNLLWALRVQPESIRWTTWSQRLHLLPAVPGFIQVRVKEILRRTADPIYNRSAFNEHGDFVNHLGLPSPTLKLYSIQDGNRFNTQAIEELWDFAQYAQSQGAITVMAYPAIAESFWQFADNRAVIHTLDQVLRREPAIETIGTPQDFVLPDAMFFDTVYHLSGKGRQVRSTHIALALQEYTQATYMATHQ